MDPITGFAYPKEGDRGESRELRNSAVFAIKCAIFLANCIAREWTSNGLVLPPLLLLVVDGVCVEGIHFVIFN